MEEKKNKFLIKSYKQMFMVIGIFTLVLFVVGTTYAFFNYTRTGVANNIKTGRIYFNSTQNGTLNMTNIFPMTSTQASTGTLDTVTVGIQGDTTYADGEEFEITLTGINNTINDKQIPINYIATYTAVSGKDIGTESETYWESRNSKNANIYTLTETGKVEEGKQVLVGYIKNGETGIEGTLTIKAYIDADRIAISDTYNPNAVAPIPGTGEETPGTQTTNNLEKISPTLLASSSSGNPTTDEYGTTSEWVNGRTVLTTEEWNSFQNSSTPISFKIKAESNEGIWVEEPSQGTIESCPDCKFIYTTDTMYTTWNDENVTPAVLTSGYSTNYNDIVTNTEKNYFLGVVTNASNQITNAYVCGVKDNEPFCIEGTSDGSKYSANSSLINGVSLWNNSCEINLDINTGYGYDETSCGTWGVSAVSAITDSTGFARIGFGLNNFFCSIDSNGSVYCEEYYGD